MPWGYKHHTHWDPAGGALTQTQMFVSVHENPPSFTRSHMVLVFGFNYLPFPVLLRVFVLLGMDVDQTPIQHPNVMITGVSHSPFNY